MTWIKRHRIGTAAGVLLLVTIAWWVLAIEA